MFFAILSNHLLDAVGIYQLITTTIKITRGHHVRRWFF